MISICDSLNGEILVGCANGNIRIILVGFLIDLDKTNKNDRHKKSLELLISDNDEPIVAIHDVSKK